MGKRSITRVGPLGSRTNVTSANAERRGEEPPSLSPATQGESVHFDPLGSQAQSWAMAKKPPRRSADSDPLPPCASAPYRRSPQAQYVGDMATTPSISPMDPLVQSTSPSPTTAPIGSNASATPRVTVDAKRRTATTKKTEATHVPDLSLVRERMRGRLALAFVVPLASVVPLALLGLLFRRLSVGDVKELLASLGLTPLICTAMGFYFGRVTK